MKVYFIGIGSWEGVVCGVYIDIGVVDVFVDIGDWVGDGSIIVEGDVYFVGLVYFDFVVFCDGNYFDLFIGL